MSKPIYIKWFKKSNFCLKTADGKDIEVWEFDHQQDNATLSDWAIHFRNMYCDDDLIDALRDGTGKTREEYLLGLCFPNKTNGFGPATRSGDFGELLVADFLEYIENYWTPRTRYDLKANRDISTPGSDVIAIKYKDGAPSKNDELLIVEAKSQFSGIKASPRLQEAIDDSKKDEIRISESLNAMKHRYLLNKEKRFADRIKRFQNPLDNPFIQKYGAAALFTDSVFDTNIIQQANCSNYKNKDKLRLLVFYGKDMMNLVHSLYERAANEA